MATGAVAVSSGGGGGGGGIRWNQRAARQSGFYLGLSLGRCRGALHGHPFEALHRVCDLLDLFRDLELHLQLLDLLLQRLDLRFLHAGNRRTQKNWELRVLLRCCHWAQRGGLGAHRHGGIPAVPRCARRGVQQPCVPEQRQSRCLTQQQQALDDRQLGQPAGRCASALHSHSWSIVD